MFFLLALSLRSVGVRAQAQGLITVSCCLIAQLLSSDVIGLGGLDGVALQQIVIFGAPTQDAYLVTMAKPICLRLQGVGFLALRGGFSSIVCCLAPRALSIAIGIVGIPCGLLPAGFLTFGVAT